jgi:hypothetical protein
MFITGHEVEYTAGGGNSTNTGNSNNTGSSNNSPALAAAGR